MGFSLWSKAGLECEEFSESVHIAFSLTTRPISKSSHESVQSVLNSKNHQASQQGLRFIGCSCLMFNLFKDE